MAGGTRYWLYGWHAARAALANPARGVLQGLEARGIPLETASRAELDALLTPGAVHQGLALEVRPLAPPALADWLDRSGFGDPAPEPRVTAGRAVLLALDQVSDPHNVGALYRRRQPGPGPGHPQEARLLGSRPRRRGGGGPGGG
jgi:23S rRNA (guanosine2251-2'-O)-methyltransferase